MGGGYVQKTEAMTQEELTTRMIAVLEQNLALNQRLVEAVEKLASPPAGTPVPYTCVSHPYVELENGQKMDNR